MEKEKFLDFLETIRGQRVFVQTHNFPDPDAIGSGFGLVKLLEHFGIKSELVFVGQIDRLNTKKMTDLCNIKIQSFDELEVPMAQNDPVGGIIIMKLHLDLHIHMQVGEQMLRQRAILLFELRHTQLFHLIRHVDHVEFHLLQINICVQQGAQTRTPGGIMLILMCDHIDIKVFR